MINNVINYFLTNSDDFIIGKEENNYYDDPVSIIINNIGIINLDSYDNNSYNIYNNIYNNQNISDEQKKYREMYNRSISKFNRDDNLFENLLTERSSNYNIRQFFIQDSPHLMNQYNRISALGYNPMIGNTGYYNQSTDYKYDSVYGQSNFRNGYIPSYNNYRPLYNNYNYYNTYNDDINNSINMLNIMSNIISTGNEKVHQKSKDEIELEILEKENYNKLIKWGTYKDSDIRVLQVAYNITEEDLNTEKHLNALKEIEEQESIFIDSYIDSVIYNNAIPLLYNQINNNIQYYYYSSPMNNIKTVEDYNNYIIYNRYVEDYNREQKERRERYLNEFKKFKESDECKAIHQVGTPDQIYNSYLSRNNNNLAKYLYENKQNSKNLSENNPMSNIELMSDGSLSVKMNPDYEEVRKLREIRRKDAYLRGINMHQ